MTTSYSTTSITTSFAGRMATWISPETQRLVALGRERHWDVAVLGQAPLPSEPLHLGDWLIAPVSQDSSYIPARALERVQTIYAAGFRPLGFVLVHEAPPLLAAPAQEQQAILKLPTISPKLKSTLAVAASVAGMVTLGLVGLAGLAALAAAAASVAAVLALPAALIMGAALVDPMLVAVTEDGFWIEIDRWVSSGRRSDA